MGIEYSADLAIRICSRLAEGEPLKTICEGDDFPDRATVYQWLANKPGFLTMYQVARDQHADAEFERMTEIVNAKPPLDDKGRVDPGWVQQQRLKVDTLKWQLARMSPKKYSERFEVVGAGGEALIPLELTQDRMLEGAKRIAFALARAEHLQSNREPLRLVHEVPSVDLYGMPMPHRDLLKPN